MKDTKRAEQVLPRMPNCKSASPRFAICDSVTRKYRETIFVGSRHRRDIDFRATGCDHRDARNEYGK
jgi:hypothetical protein